MDLRKNKCFARVLILLISFVLISGQMAVSQAYAMTNKQAAKEISKQEETFIEAYNNLKAAEKKYKKQQSEMTEQVTSEDLKDVGREFIDYMVEKAYEKDSKKADKSTLVPLEKLTVQGNIDKAKTVSSAKAAINKLNNSSKSDRTYDGMVTRALSISNINKAISLIEKCNYYRKNRNIKALKISPYLMAAAVASAPITYKNGTHTLVKAGKLQKFDGSKAYESYCYGYSDPFYLWYTVERQRAANGQGGTEHFRLIISTNCRQTGASWNDQINLANQLFSKNSKGTAYSTSDFRDLFDDYVKARKKEIRAEKKAFINGTLKPDYLLKAEKKYNKALKNLKNAAKEYTASVKVSKNSYNSVKVSYSIPKTFKGVQIFRKDLTTGSKYVKVKTKTSGTLFTDKGLKTGHQYQYRIRYYKKLKGEYIYSSYSSVKKITPRLSRVTNLGYHYVNQGGAVVVTWDPVANADGYQVYFRKADTEDETYEMFEDPGPLVGLSLSDFGIDDENFAFMFFDEPGTYEIVVKAYVEGDEDGSTGLVSKVITIVIEDPEDVQDPEEPEDSNEQEDAEESDGPQEEETEEVPEE